MLRTVIAQFFVRSCAQSAAVRLGHYVEHSVLEWRVGTQLWQMLWEHRVGQYLSGAFGLTICALLAMLGDKRLAGENDDG